MAAKNSRAPGKEAPQKYAEPERFKTLGNWRECCLMDSLNRQHRHLTVKRNRVEKHRSQIPQETSEIKRHADSEGLRRLQ